MAVNVETNVDEFHVALLRLNRPEARNALSPEMMDEIASELERFDPDPEIRCVVIAGSEKVFAAGADIRAMAERCFARRSTTRRPVSGAAGGDQDATGRRRLRLGAGWRL